MGRAATLVVGGDSMIGAALMRRWQSADLPVVGTSRRSSSHGMLSLDLADDLKQWSVPGPIDVAILCAGVTRLETCRRDSLGSRQVNVMGITSLARTLIKAGTFVIYLSTNQVFDGHTPYAPADGRRAPLTEYGRQKTEAEENLLKIDAEYRGQSVAIVRLTKVFNLAGDSIGVFTSWHEKLHKGEAIHPFSDMQLAPVPLACVVSILQLICANRLPGCWQVSGDRDVTYAEVAQLAVDLIGLSPSLVQPIRSAQSDSYSELVPQNTTLDVTRLRSELGVQPPDVTWVLASALKMHGFTKSWQRAL